MHSEIQDNISNHCLSSVVYLMQYLHYFIFHVHNIYKYQLFTLLFCKLPCNFVLTSTHKKPMHMQGKLAHTFAVLQKLGQ